MGPWKHNGGHLEHGMLPDCQKGAGARSSSIVLVAIPGGWNLVGMIGHGLLLLVRLADYSQWTP